MPQDFFHDGQQTIRLQLENAGTSDERNRTAQDRAVAMSFWACVQPVHEELGFSGESAITHRIWVSHSNQIRTGMRFRRGVRIFSIRIIHDPDEGGRYFVCQVTEE